MPENPTAKPDGRTAAAQKAKKPYPEFPLTPHASGAWQKKIRGKIHYFGKWARVVDGKLVRIEGDGWEEALELYRSQADDLHAGRTPRVTSDALTVADLCNRFLTAKQRKVDADEMSSRMLHEYKQTTDRLVKKFGKNRRVADLAADDFSALRVDLAKQFGPVRLGTEIQKVRTVFKYALGQGLIDRPVQIGEEFKKPSKRVMRQHRNKTGKRMFEADELRGLIDAAGVPMKAMILLGINAAFGNSDCGHLPKSAIDLEAGWVTFPRPKSGIERRCHLWPETIQAVKDALDKRPTPKDDADDGLVFITKYGYPWSVGGNSGPVALETGKLLRKLKLNRPGLGFYALRHTFRTIADATRDFPAVRLVMGHADDTIDDVYRERIDDGRLQAVAEHVRAWLFGTSPDDTTDDSDSKGSELADEPESPEEGTPASLKSDSAFSAGHRPALKLYVG